jgi:alpha-1,2-glucosyltransferase
MTNPAIRPLSPDSLPQPPPRANWSPSQLALLLLTALLAIWSLSRAWHLHDRLILDEAQVLGQVKLFLAAKLELFRWPGTRYPAAATLPGFPAVLASIAAVTGQSSPSVLRVYCFAFSIIYGAVLYAIARRLTPDHAVLRATQTYLLPIVFPFNCLMYTDLFSLLICASAFLATLRRSYTAAGLLMLFSICIRQTNVVFIIFLCGYGYLENNGIHFTLQRALTFLRQSWPLLLGLAAFAIFVLVNGRIALDDPTQQPIAFSPGNLAISLVILAILFLPALLPSAPRVLPWARDHWRITLLLALVAGVVAFTYNPSHPWNYLGSQLRNHLMWHLLTSNLRRCAFAFILIFTLLFILAIGFIRPAAWMLPIFWFLSLAPIVLVEPRYHFPALVLFQLLRKPQPPRIEFLLWCWFAIGSIAFTYVMTATHYVL